MSCSQSITGFANSKINVNSRNWKPRYCSVPVIRSARSFLNRTGSNRKAFPRLVTNSLKNRGFDPLCASTSPAKWGDGSEYFPLEMQNSRMKDLGNELSSEAFWKHVQERRFNGLLGGIKNLWSGDGGIVKPPSGGGGSGGGGGGFFSSDNGEFRKYLDELQQVILATIGFIFMYICIVRGEELMRLGIDYVRYLSGARKTARLRRASEKWIRFCQGIGWRKGDLLDDEPTLGSLDNDSNSDDYLI